MAESYYESSKGLGEYLLFHYGRPNEVLPWTFGPDGSLDYPLRCVTECFDHGSSTSGATTLPYQRALDLGCAVGRSTFELARICQEVVGIDYSKAFIDAATHLKESGRMRYEYVEEGSLSAEATATVPDGIDRDRVQFEQGDATALREDLGMFDALLMANLIDRLPDPAACLARLPTLVRRGGRLVITSPYTWLNEYTSRNQWLGGYHDGDSKAPVSTLQGLKARLGSHFELLTTRDLPFLIREHRRKYQWSVAEASIWVRR